nr:hypothetical protein [uncultured Mediterranean phage uvMED]
MAYTTIDKPTDYFNTVLYTGDGATSTAGTLARTISGVGFQSDWTWVKGRTSGGYNSHGLHDAVRGAPKWLGSDGSDQEYDVRTEFSAGGIGSFTSDGFGIFSGTAGTTTNYNTSSTTYVAWNWKAGGSASSNSNGSITSTVSANTTAGFSIVSYTGTGSNATVGHGLGANMDFAIFKLRSGSSAWLVYHKSLGATKAIYLNETGAVGTNSSGFNDTEPTSSVFSLGSGATANTSGGTQIAYCFAEKKGYSKFGSYTGNGNADGTFIYTGFKPAFVIIKVSSRAGFNWVMYDNKRDTFNTVGQLLKPSSSSAELDDSNLIDFLSNGIKMRNNSLGTNGSGDTYIYMAFAENPFVTSTGIPSCAR